MGVLRQRRAVRAGWYLALLGGAVIGAGGAAALVPMQTRAHAVYLPAVAATAATAPAPSPTPLAATPTMTAVPSPSAPAGVLTVLSSTAYAPQSDTEPYRVYGEVYNGTQQIFTYLYVILHVFDAHGQHLASDENLAWLPETFPGQRNPFAIRLTQPPPGIARYSFAFRSAQTPLEHYVPVTVQSQAVRSIDPYRFEVYGELRNDRAVLVGGARVAVTFYDQAGKVMFTEATELDNTEMPAGGTRSYSLIVHRPDWPAYSTLAVQAQAQQ